MCQTIDSLLDEGILFDEPALIPAAVVHHLDMFESRCRRCG